MKNEIFHIPVLLKEVLYYLKPEKGQIIFDGTLGGAGHSIEIFKAIAPTGKLIGVDKCSQTISTAARKLKKAGGNNENIKLVNDNFANISIILSGLGVKKIDGMLLDLGLSSFQIDESGGGFSYLRNEKLDMRFDSNQGLDAGYIINNYSNPELVKIFREYGEEKFSRKIAENIVHLRTGKKIEYTAELVKIIENSIPLKYRKKYGHPAKRVFQALRIEVNNELENLKKTIEDSFESLNTGGRMVIISYHSLEDRIVKRKFKEYEEECTCPPEFPVCICGKIKEAEILTRKAIKPQPEEITLNPRAKSARLRAIRKI